MTVKFSATPLQMRLIRRIVERAAKVWQQTQPGSTFPARSLVMDLDACISNGCPLRLEELVAANDFDFVHDVFGIVRHMDRTTGQLGNCFWPRHAVQV